MRRLLTFILLVAVFLAGYYMGRSPGSPDIIAKADQAYTYIKSAVSAPPKDAPASPQTSQAGEGMKFTLGGTTFTIGGGQAQPPAAPKP